MRRWFHGFPAGRAGSGLLVLRIALGLQLLATSSTLLDPAIHVSPLPAVTAGIVTLLGGVASLLGIATPLALLLVVVAHVSNQVAILATGSPQPVSGGALAGLTLAISVALVMLGPGAYSIDAYLFGRREIHIPRVASRS